MHCKGEQNEDDDSDAMESAPSSPATAMTAAAAPVAEALAEGAIQNPAPETPAAAPTEEKEGPAMAESTTPAAETAAVPATGGVHLTDEQFQMLLARVAPAAPATPVESATAEPVAEATAPAAAPVAETEEQRIDRLVAEKLAAALPAAVQEHVAQHGAPARKGLVAPVNENTPTAGAEPGLNQYGVPADWPDKPLHEYSPDERTKYFGPTLRQHVLQDRFRG